MHAEVGDTIKVVFKNDAHIPYSMHPHGVFLCQEFRRNTYNNEVNPFRNLVTKVILGRTSAGQPVILGQARV